jgi:N-acetylneuraminic acid mutarotase
MPVTRVASRRFPVLVAVALLVAIFSKGGSSQGSWTSKAPMPAPRYAHAAVGLSGLIHVVGGSDGSNCSALTAHDVYDPAADAWVAKAPMLTPRSFPAAAVLNNGVKDLIYVVGGSTGCSTRTATMEAYDPDTNSWTMMAPMPGGERSVMGAAVIDGLMYVVGGLEFDGFNSVTTLVEAYDPLTDSWATKPPMPTERYAMAIGAIDGILYVAGGASNTAALASADAFDPATNIWTPMAPMPVPRLYGAGTVANGRLYFIGGQNTAFLATGGRYDPATNTWTAITALPGVRAHAPAAAANGHVFVLGGHDGAGALASTLMLTEDSTAPSTTATPSLAPNGNGWNNSDVAITLHATDDPGGSGVQSITYALTGAQSGGGTFAGSSTAFTIVNEGTTTVTYHATDGFGNVEADHVLTLNLDKTAPVLGALPDLTATAPTSAGTAITFGVPASDVLSGVAAVNVSPNSSGMIFPIGTTHETVTVFDVAGNSAIAGFDVTVTLSAPSFETASFFGGPNDQRGTSIAISGGAIYVSGNRQPEAQNHNDGALVMQYAMPPGPSPTWSRPFGSGSQLLGIAAASDGVYAAGASYSLTNDPAGGKEPKTLLAKFAIDGSAGPGAEGSAWIAGGPGNLGPFFTYSGVEFFQGVTTAVEGSSTSIYTAQGGQPCSFSAYIVAKYGTAGNFIAAATDSTVGVAFNTCSVPSGGGSNTPTLVVLNGNIYLAGVTAWPHEGDGGVLGKPALYKYNSTLGLQWRQRDAGVNGSFHGLTALGNALYAVGSTYGGAPGTEDYLIEKYDEAGNMAWRRTSGGPNSDLLTGVVAVGTRLFAVGHTKSHGGGGADGVVLEIDPANGEILSTTLYGGAQDDKFNGVATDGTDLYAVGESRSFSVNGNAAGQNDGVLVRYALAAPAVPAAPPTASFTATPNPAACGQVIDLDASASQAGPGRNIVQYAWTFGDGTSLSAGGPFQNHIYNQFGTYTATMVVTDNGVPALSSPPASVVIDVTAGNQPPFANPGGPYSVTSGNAVTLNGTNSSDQNASCGDSIVSYAWTIDGTIQLSGPTPSLNTAVHPLSAGSHSVSLTVTDEFGATGTMSTSVNVIMPDSTPPTTSANFPAPNANGWNRFNVNVNLNAFDSGGVASPSGVQSITYTVTGAQTGGGTFNTSSTSVFINTEGTTTITYHATDNAGNVEADHVLVVKLDKTAPSVANLSNIVVNATSTAGAVVTFNLAQSDALSGVASTVFTQGQPSGSTFPHGMTNENVTVTDLAGNSTSRFFNITVNKTLLSIAVSPSASSVDMGGGQSFTAMGHFTNGPDQMLPTSGGGGPVPGNAPWHLHFSPGLNVSACASVTGGLSSQVIAPNAAGAVVNQDWGNSSIVRVNGTVTPLEVDLTLACNPPNGATGTLHASWTGTRYEGTVTFSGSTAGVIVSGWSPKASMPSARFSFGAAADNGIVYALGGGNPSQPQPVDAYNPATDSWATVSQMPTSREGAAVASLNGLIYVAGGHVSGGMASGILQSYEPATNTWTELAAMPTPRAHLALVVAGGKLYAIGGETGSGTGPPTAVVERYDPALNQWTARTSMAAPRSFLVAGALNSETTIVAAGGNGTFGSVELYDVAGNTWTAGPAMLSSGGSPAAVVVNNALYVFGIGGNGIGVHMFRPTGALPTGWVALAMMPTGRGQSGVAAVGDVVYAIGGLVPGGSTATAVVEAFSTPPPGDFTVSQGGGGGGGGGSSLPTVSWQSTNASVAGISTSGFATGNAPGQTTIVATAAGVSCATTSTCATLTVNDEPASISIVLAPGSAVFPTAHVTVINPSTGDIEGEHDVPLPFTTDLELGPVRLLFAAPAGYAVTPAQVDLDVQGGDDITVPLFFEAIDTVPPVVSLFGPSPDAFIATAPSTVPVEVEVIDAGGVLSVTINGVNATLNGATPLGTRWLANLSTPAGTALTINATAIDGAANQGHMSATIDNDGIAKAIDKGRTTAADESGVFSSDFNDGTTAGTLLRTGGGQVSVAPRGAAVGVTLASAGSVRTTACTGTIKSFILNSPGESADVSCAGDTVTVKAISTPDMIEVFKLNTGARLLSQMRCFFLPLAFRHDPMCQLQYSSFSYQYDYLISLPQGQSVSTGSPVTAGAGNTLPIHVTLVQIADDGTPPFPVAEFDLDPGEAVDVRVEEGTNRQDHLTFSVLQGTVTIDVGGVTQTVEQGQEGAVTPDLTSPVITVPANVIKEAASASGAVVNFSASAADDIDGPRPVSCVPASGSTFPVATTTVSCTAGDLHGNQNTATFTVRVIPKNTKPPKVKAPNNMKVEATGPSGAVVTFAATATDKVDGSIPVACAPASGAAFPLGATDVTCSATNSFGLSDTDSFTITVRDTTAPLINSVTPSVTLLPDTDQTVPVSIAVDVADAVDPAPACRITKVVGHGKDLNHDGVIDWTITGDLTLDIKASARKHRDRTYRITVRCTDASGNTSKERTAIVISHASSN